MREYNATLLIFALVCNTILTTVAITIELISTLEVFLLVWFVPTVAFIIWAGALYHKSN